MAASSELDPVQPLEPFGSGGLEVQPDPRARGGLGRYAARLSLTALGTFVFILVFNFFLFNMLPGNGALLKRGRGADPEALLEQQRALNQPLGTKFLDYLQNPFSLGKESMAYSRPVWSVISDRIWPTVILLGIATMVSVVLGVWIGIRSGWQRGSRFDKVATGLTLGLWGVPEFWLGMMLLILLASGIGPFLSVFPTGGFISEGVDPWSPEGVLNILWHVALPATALALVYLAEYSLIMRASIVDESKQDYLTTGRAYGLMDKQVRRRHALPNASLPTITLVFLNVGFIVSGAITVEYVFSWPGLGALSVDAIRGPDLNLLQALFMLFTVSVLIATTLADLVIAVIDPRIRT
jgi:peptide/nickel transport system permease protein